MFSKVIDTNIMLGIKDEKKITENFIKEIRNNKLETWTSLEKYIDSKYFYYQCVKYVKQRKAEYIDRYKAISDKGRLTDGQINFLKSLIEKALKHKDYTVRMKGLDELEKLLNLLSKSSGGYYIDRFKDILGYTVNNSKNT